MWNAVVVRSKYLIILKIFVIGLVLLFGLVLSGAVDMFAGSRPKNLGVQAGKLKPCPNKPNCVSSQVEASDSHYIAPLAFSGSASDAIMRIKKIIAGQERTQLISEAPNYLYAEFKSKLMGYVDDVEFYADENARLIHVRSASRLGYRDFNVNRERIKAIHEQFSGNNQPPPR
jgi:uncharacterized protein (DUF1499 family)